MKMNEGDTVASIGIIPKEEEAEEAVDTKDVKAETKPAAKKATPKSN